MTLEEYQAFLRSMEGVDFLTVEEAAKLLRTSQPAICEQINLGRLPIIPLGAKGQTWRIYRHDLRRLRTTLDLDGNGR